MSPITKWSQQELLVLMDDFHRIIVLIIYAMFEPESEWSHSHMKMYISIHCLNLRKLEESEIAVILCYLLCDRTIIVSPKETFSFAHPS